jgi:hypothetical protein
VAAYQDSRECNAQHKRQSSQHIEQTLLHIAQFNLSEPPISDVALAARRARASVFCLHGFGVNVSFASYQSCPAVELSSNSRIVV